MMAHWGTDDDLMAAAGASLPTPAGTPYRTPSKVSRKSRRSLTPPGLPSSSPPSLPSEKAERHDRRASNELAMESNMSMLDPRRFTPTLHANLVSEILTLRRDQEDKLKIIEGLETSLHESHKEKDDLQATLTNTAKDTRSLKRQLALLEGGTSSALSELARERDEAVDAITETRKRLEMAQKKVRAQEEDSERVYDLWAKEKDGWNDERRNFERKLHVAESRLKAVLEEVTQLHAAQANGAYNEVESEGEETGKENDAASIRTQSMTNSIRFSTVSGPGIGKMNGISLADELNFDDVEDYQTDPDGRQSVLSNFGHARNMSRDSTRSRTHKRNQSYDSLARPGSVARGKIFMNSTVLGRLEGGIQEDDDEMEVNKPEYADAAVQFSPPPSPKVVNSKPATPERLSRLENRFDVESPSRGDAEIEANQRRKRVQLNRPIAIETPKILTTAMVSSASQTSEPLSPPKTPLTPRDSLVSLKGPEMVSIGTQTKDTSVALQRAPLQIPSISIVPPTSRPTTPQEPLLPQYFKDFGCQVSLLQSSDVPTASSSTQTDEIRIDKRLDKLPPHLHPSAISSRPSSPAANPDVEAKSFTPLPGNLPPRNPRRLRKDASDVPLSPMISQIDNHETQDAYPGNNDDGPLSGSEMAPIRRPHRISSLFAGFDVASSDEGEQYGDGDASDSEYRTALSAPNPSNGASRQAKRFSASTTSTSMSPEQKRTSIRESRSIMKQIGGSEVYSSFSLADARDTFPRKSASRPPSSSMNSGSRASVMRKAAMIQSGITSHQGRTRSPSLPDIREPPFPIPTRASSRQPVFTASAPSTGSRSPSRQGGAWHRRGMRSGTYRNNSVRKVRSAAAIPRNGRNRRQASRSPPPLSPSEEGLGSPMLPPLPHNDITTPRKSDFGAPRYRSHRSQPSTNTANTENTAAVSVGSSQQASGVVDAIAQTMVGEWMFKYVRRRKSFGVADTGARGEENSNDRHKRWVWLAPYERAILWSSKQPVSGSALMGKSGRKLTIQSVLDVKDDNPVPKGATEIFNRSILILTPQRALKFTAVSADRHYVWLQSLSFLAHSQQAVPEAITMSLAPKVAPAPDPELSKPKIKRAGIRDSIRLTKGKNPSFVKRNDNQPDLVEEPVPPVNFEAFSASPSHKREESHDTAQPPAIPRFHDRSHDRVNERANQVVLHGRKRSNTGGHVPPPLSFRGFSGPGSSTHASSNSTAGVSIGTAGSSDIYGQAQGSSNMTWGMSMAGSQRTSEASSRPTGNFFEAIGTVRMEAFISPLTFPRFDDHPDENEEWQYRARRQNKDRRRQRSRSRQRDSYTSRGTRGTDSYYTGSRTGDYEDSIRGDPFRGF
ncbi:hypothetical protein F5Y16DRAFT_130021 [Xylariaceae sp. FL0255]|nr:hypothetical protein F5Y16DRAFT_130021 [Xylariaceae sp. FL0255]